MAEAAVRHEQYAQSTLTIRRMGRVALLSSGEIDFSNGDVIESYADFETAIGENLATDSEFGERLIFNQLRPYEYRDGKTRTADGRPTVDLIKNGVKSSRIAAKYDPRMIVQAERDEADETVATIADELEVGELYAVVSLEPKDALRADRAFWEGKGYRDGMAVLQVYYRLNQDTMLAGAYSIKQSSKAALSRIWSQYGKQLSVNTPDSQWILHGLRMSADAEDAEEFGKAIIKAHQSEIGNQNVMMSVTEFIASNRNLVRSCFSRYIVPLGESLVTGSTQKVIQELAYQILNNGVKYSAEEGRSLMRLANGGHIGSREASMMEEKIRYAVVEELRKLLKLQINGGRSHEAFAQYTATTMYAIEQSAFIQNMGQTMAGNIATGMAANRLYGGCAVAGRDDRTGEVNGSDAGASEQDVFGGKTTESTTEKLVWKDGICRIDNCPTRPGKTKVAQCSVCRSCQNWFDKGRDPAKLYKGIRRVQKSTVTVGFETEKEPENRKVAA